jgi:hypothetical protein
MAAGSSNPFSARLVFGLIAAGIVAFIAYAVLSAYSGDLRSGRDGRGHAMSVAAIGFRGLVDLVGYSGGRAVPVRGEEGLDSEDLLLVSIEDRTNPDALGALVERRTGRPTLLILPKWMVGPHSTKRGWVTASSPPDHLPPGDYMSILSPTVPATISHPRTTPGTLRGGGVLEGITAPLPAGVQTIAGDDLTPLLWTRDGDAVLARAGEGSLYILADPDLLNNKGLKDRRTAAAALNILDALNSTGAEAVLFDLTLNGFVRKRDVLRLAFEPPFVVLTLSLFVAALLAGLHGAVRFGPEKREERAIAFGKAALVENSAALFRLARREYRAGAAYADVVRDEAARAAAAPPGLRGADLDAYLDRLSAPGTARFSDLAARLRAAASRDELVAAARAMFQWKKEMIL